GRGPGLSLGGFDGEGVTIALLDTGVDASTPFLHGRILDGADLLDPGSIPAPRKSPVAPHALERHGTEMAGLLVGSGGPGGLGGIAPGASVLPLRVAGWQRDAVGSYAIYARTDQILAGLERAVDPNGASAARRRARLQRGRGTRCAPAGDRLPEPDRSRGVRSGRPRRSHAREQRPGRRIGDGRRPAGPGRADSGRGRARRPCRAPARRA